ncbi:MAG: hypothetical protein ABH881_02910 [bacterium]
MFAQTQGGEMVIRALLEANSEEIAEITCDGWSPFEDITDREIDAVVAEIGEGSTVKIQRIVCVGRRAN